MEPDQNSIARRYEGINVMVRILVRILVFWSGIKILVRILKRILARIVGFC